MREAAAFIVTILWLGEYLNLSSLLNSGELVQKLRGGGWKFAATRVCESTGAKLVAFGTKLFVILKNSEAVQGTLCLFERQCGDGLKVDHAGFDVGVAEELLNSLEVVAGHEQMTGKGVAETVR